MKKSVKFFVYPVAALVVFLSCKPDPMPENGNPPEGEKPVIVDPDAPSGDKQDSFNSIFSVNGDDCEIKSVGIFYNTQLGGYNIAMSSSEQDFTMSHSEVPSGVSCYFDIPLSAMDYKHSIKDISSKGSWIFQCGYSIDGSKAFMGSICNFTTQHVSEGTVYAVYFKTTLELHFEAILADGTSIKCDYKGEPAVSSDYISLWH